MTDAISSLESRVREWKQRRGAVILAHNYQPDEVQAVADFTGDSLELARKCTRLDAGVVVFCGVFFMAETAVILNPGKTVLLPDPAAGCPMADMITGSQLRAFKAEHPGARVVCYVNSTAEVKAGSDICCTSANAPEVVRSLGDGEVIFVPDRNLGSHTAEKLGRSLILWPGFCPAHQRVSAAEIEALRAAHPGAPVLVHPECPKPVRDAADFVLSTGQMCRHARQAPERAFIIGTEQGVLCRLRAENPGKTFHLASDRLFCPDMKKITLEKVLRSLEGMRHRVTVEPAVAARARRAIEAMLAVPG